MPHGVPTPRLCGFLALAVLAALEWGRLVEGLGMARPLLWVVLAAGAGAAIWAVSTLPHRGRRPAGILVAVTALLAAVPAAGLDVGLLRPARWGELASRLSDAAGTLVAVRLPYAGVDPWPALTLQLLGALLCVTAGLLTFWPRPAGRGYPFFALAALLVLSAAPLISLGGGRSVLFSVVLAALAVCFLWLERIPLRPGIGLTALTAIAFVGALPLAGAADREAPWFDFRGFAESVGPQDPARFDWRHAYGPMDWPRTRREVLRVTTRGPGGPEYWKASTLDEFDREAWVSRGSAESREPVAAAGRPEWTRTFDVSVGLLATSDVIGPGTIVDVPRAGRPVREGPSAGRWVAPSPLRRGDAYTVRSYTPRPRPEELRTASTGTENRKSADLVVQVPFRDDVPRRLLPRDFAGDRVSAATVRFPAFAEGGAPRAQYLDPDFPEQDGSVALRRSAYDRTWRLARSLRRRARTPYDYVAAVERHLRGPDFEYSERPPASPYGVAPLEGFLFDTKAGYCQHYSGAMALLLRMGGVPARVAAGFSPGGYSSSRKQWVVRDTDAHSWVEVWFDPFGWVVFDPTPADTPARSLVAAATTEAGPGDAAVPATDAAGAGQRVGRERLGFREADGGDDDAGAGAPGPTEGEGGSAGLPWLVALAGLAGLGTLGVMRARRAPRPAAPLDRAIAELEAAVRRVGRPAATGTTLRQLEARFERSEEAVAYIRALRRARYSAQAPQPTPGQRRAVRRELGRGRGRLGRLRALWALPPGRRHV